MGGIHITPLQSLEMCGPSSELLQLLIYFSIIKFTIKFITKVCLLRASSAVLFRGPPPLGFADPRDYWRDPVAKAARWLNLSTFQHWISSESSAS